MSGAYFERVPDFLYPSILNDRTSSLETVTVKNLFRRVKIREDIFDNLVALEQYRIKGDERADQVAHLFYGSSTLDWLVMIVNNTIDPTFSWPMKEEQFYNYLITKYGSETNFNNVKFYLTKEVKDFAGNVMLEAGITVDEDYTFEYYDSTLERQISVSGNAARRPVTNFEYEIDINEQRRSIYILRPEYVDQAIRDSVTELRYKESSDYLENNLKKTENIRITSPNR